MLQHYWRQCRICGIEANNPGRHPMNMLFDQNCSPIIRNRGCEFTRAFGLEQGCNFPGNEIQHKDIVSAIIQLSCEQ